MQFIQLQHHCARAQHASRLSLSMCTYPSIPFKSSDPFQTPSDAAKKMRNGESNKKNHEKSRPHFNLTDHIHSSYPLTFLYIFLCCSRNMKVATVCGPSLMKLGTQPLKTQPRPSFAVMRVTRLTMPS